MLDCFGISLSFSTGNALLLVSSRVACVSKHSQNKKTVGSIDGLRANAQSVLVASFCGAVRLTLIGRTSWASATRFGTRLQV